MSTPCCIAVQTYLAQFNIPSPNKKLYKVTQKSAYANIARSCASCNKPPKIISKDCIAVTPLRIYNNPMWAPLVFPNKMLGKKI